MVSKLTMNLEKSIKAIDIKIERLEHRRAELANRVKEARSELLSPELAPITNASSEKYASEIRVGVKVSKLISRLPGGILSVQTYLEFTDMVREERSDLDTDLIIIDVSPDPGVREALKKWLPPSSFMDLAFCTAEGCSE